MSIRPLEGKKINKQSEKSETQSSISLQQLLQLLERRKDLSSGYNREAESHSDSTLVLISPADDCNH